MGKKGGCRGEKSKKKEGNSRALLPDCGEDEKQLTGRYFVHLPVSSALLSVFLIPCSLSTSVSECLSVCVCVCLVMDESC